MINSHNKHGFTLVELAIVITIIGILIGGVLKGQQLIEQARLASTVTQVNGYKSAVAIFTTKYDAYPGDMANPDNRIVGCSGCAAASGTGDGRVGNGNLSNQSSPIDGELTRFWLHLLKADLIMGVDDTALQSGADTVFGKTHPNAKIAGGFVVAHSTGGACGSYPEGVAWSSGCRPPSGLYAVIVKQPYLKLPYVGENARPLKAAEVASLDRKMDDGAPRSGEVLAAGWLGNASAANCRNNTSLENVYVEGANDALACAVGFYIWD